jgi:integrase
MQLAVMSLYDKFIHSCKSEVTKKEYTAALKRFMSHYEIKGYEDILKLSVKEAEEMLIDYVLFMKKGDLSRGYVTQQIAAVKRFLFMNDVVLNWNKIVEYKGEFKRKQKDEAYSHEQIEKILQICDIRSRAVVLIFASTGIRIGALPELKLKSVNKIGDLYQFTIYEGYDQEYTTFCSPECATAIDNYLSFRERQGEKLDGESYLIRQEFDISDLEQIRRKSKPVSSSTIRNVVWRYMIKTGIRKVNHTADKGHRKKIAEMHGFRKFYTSQLVNAGLNTEKRWLLEGHSLRGNDNSYVKPTLKELQEEYFKAIDLLTIDPANRLKKQVKELQEDEDDILQVKEELASMKDQFQAFITTVAGMDQTHKNKFAKQLLANGTYKKTRSG